MTKEGNFNLQEKMVIFTFGWFHIERINGTIFSFLKKIVHFLASHTL